MNATVPLSTMSRESLIHQLYEAAGMINQGYFFTLPL